MTKKCLQKYIVAMLVLVIVLVYTGCCVDEQEYYRQRENYRTI